MVFPSKQIGLEMAIANPVFCASGDRISQNIPHLLDSPQPGMIPQRPLTMKTAKIYFGLLHYLYDSPYMGKSGNYVLSA